MTVVASHSGVEAKDQRGRVGGAASFAVFRLERGEEVACRHHAQQAAVVALDDGDVVGALVQQQDGFEWRRVGMDDIVRLDDEVVHGVVLDFAHLFAELVERVRQEGEILRMPWPMSAAFGSSVA